jgi:hypothetical protein
VSAAREAAIKAGGITPLDFLIETYRDKDQPMNIRVDSAKAAAQYVHPKLSAVTLSGDPENPVEQRVTHVDEKQVGAAVEKLQREY